MKSTERNIVEKKAMRLLGPVHVKAPNLIKLGLLTGRGISLGNPKRCMLLCEHACHWTEKVTAISLVQVLKGFTAELLQKVPSDSQNTSSELVKALKLQYGLQHLRDVYCTQTRAR